MSDRAIKAIASATATVTFGLGTLLAIPVVWILDVIAKDLDLARLVAISAAIAYPGAAGYLASVPGEAPAGATESRRHPLPPATPGLPPVPLM